VFPLPCMLVCMFVCASRTRDRGCSKRSSLRPLISKRANEDANLGRPASREREVILSRHRPPCAQLHTGAGDPVFQSISFEPRSCGVLDTPPSRGMTAKYVSRRRTPKRYSKHFRARGRIALSGVGLRPQGPGGGSRRTSFRESCGVKRPEALEVKEKLGQNCLEYRLNALNSRRFQRPRGADEWKSISPQVPS
jgi:hypothetical protein